MPAARFKSLAVCLLASGLLAGCQTVGFMGDSAGGFLRDRERPTHPKPSAFSYCFDYGCEKSKTVSLSDADWSEITMPLRASLPTPAAEREALRTAVARYEVLAGRLAGADRDLGGTWPGFGRVNQLDCIDETINTTTLLVMLHDAALLKHHEPGAPVGRGTFFQGLPHRSATVTETAGGARYAIDSWFHDNGELPEVVSTDVWLAGWNPGDPMTLSAENAQTGKRQ